MDSSTKDIKNFIEKQKCEILMLNNLLQSETDPYILHQTQSYVKSIENIIELISGDIEIFIKEQKLKLLEIEKMTPNTESSIINGFEDCKKRTIEQLEIIKYDHKERLKMFEKMSNKYKRLFEQTNATPEVEKRSYMKLVNTPPISHMKLSPWSLENIV